MIRETNNRQNESGSAIFYVLIAVSLLGALIFAVSNSSRDSTKHLSEDKARLIATDLIEYSNTVANGVAQIRLRGVADTSLCFDDPQWPADYNHAGCTDDRNKIFHVSGAGVVWSKAKNEAMDSAATPDELWHFYGNNEIDQVGTTCGAANCADLIMVADELLPEICIELNNKLGVTNPSGAPPTDTAFNETLYKGAYGFNNVIGDEGGGVYLRGKTSACFQKTGAPAEYVFYKVLVAR